MSCATEAFARVRVDAFLKDAGWNLVDISVVHYEWTLSDSTQAYIPVPLLRRARWQ